MCFQKVTVQVTQMLQTVIVTPSSFDLLTFVYERQSAVLISSVGPGVVGGRVQVNHEVRLLPTVLLQSAPQLLVAPDGLQHHTSAADLPVRAVTEEQEGSF